MLLINFGKLISKIIKSILDLISKAILRLGFQTVI